MKPLPASPANGRRRITNGRAGQFKVERWLRKIGKLRTRMAPWHCPYDLLVETDTRGVFNRVEVKSSDFCQGRWFFNIHRHNKMTENHVDFYVLRLDKFPYRRKAMHLVIKSPIGKRTIKMTLQGLVSKYGVHANRTDLLRIPCEKSLDLRHEQD
jgi:hypothetical protein